MDRIGEADVFDSHYEIDGVEVFFAGKTSGEVGLFFKRRIQTVTQGAGKPGRPLTGIRGLEQGLNQPVNRDQVS